MAWLVLLLQTDMYTPCGMRNQSGAHAVVRMP
jgi:hypothetical protein